MTASITSSTASTSTDSTNTASTSGTPALGLGRATLMAVVGAAVANVAVAAAARAGGVDLAIQGEEIPILGFPQLTALFVLVGAGLAWIIGRRAARPRQTFLRLTVGLTALSCVPSVLVDAGAATKSVLVMTHLVAAAIAIPALRSTLRR
jgi:hypothetical protein